MPAANDNAFETEARKKTLMGADTTAMIASRLDRLPASAHIRNLVALLSLGGWFEFYDLFFTAYIAVGLYSGGIFRPTMAGVTDLHAFLQGFASFVAALFLGLFIGTLAFSALADRFGRRAVFTVALLWYSAAALMMAFARSPEAIDFWRLVAGIGLGVELVNIDAYVSELVPKRARGAMFAYNQFIMFTAVPAAAFISWQLVPLTVFGIDGWRLVVAIGALGAIPVWWLRRSLPESPRWLAQHGRGAEAERIVAAIEHKVSHETRGALPPPEPGEPPRAPKPHAALREIWSKAYRGRTAMLIVFNVLQTIGYYGFASWVPSFLISQGIDATRSLAYTFVIALSAPAGPLIGIFLAERFERKWQIAIPAIGIAVFGLAFAQQREAATVIACGVLVTLCNNWMSFSFHAYQAELYPTRIRARAVGFVYSWSRFNAIFSGYVIAALLDRYGTGGVFGFIAGSMLLLAGVIGTFGPKVSGRGLEDIAA
jgi:putative MFS transporter